MSSGFEAIRAVLRSFGLLVCKKAGIHMTKLTTPPFTAAYTQNLFNPGKTDDGDDRYNLVAIWTPGKFGPKAQKLWDAIMAELDRVSMAAFKKPWDKLPSNFKKGLRQGEEREEDGFGEGRMFATLATYQPPNVKDLASGDPIGPDWKNTKLVYSGCTMIGTVKIKSFDNKSKGLRFELHNLLKVGDGKRLDGRSSADEDFKNVEIDSEYLEQLESSVEDSIYE